MGRKVKKAAYVVFHGRRRGLYYTWDECQEQVHGFPAARFQGYITKQEAEEAWNAIEHTVCKSLEEGKLNAALENAYPLRSPLIANPLKRARTTESIESPEGSGGAEEPSTREYIVISSDEEEEQPGRKKPKTEADFSGDDIGSEYDVVKGELGLGKEESSFKLTAAQEAVVQMAVNGDNIFLTGAAGSGKTATLKEILRRIRKKHLEEPGNGRGSTKFPRLQVVAPTGIAALPLNGKTTFSFAGWNTNSFQQPLEKLLRNVSKQVWKAMQRLDVLIIEEISMVEAQFLERLDCRMQNVLGKSKPFGGVQVIFLGDFYQLPPVLPFQYCLSCGEAMINQKVEPVCNSDKCENRRIAFKLGDKWAFRARVWTELRLRHVKLEQIHRQKDAAFQNVLNKIRNGILLSDDEWCALEVKKEEMSRAFPIKLMSRRDSVKRYNEDQLSLIKSNKEVWNALDSGHKLQYDSGDELHPRATQILRDLEGHKKSLKDHHRLATTLVQKIGAKVVLLSNLAPERGLVNGSQGEVIKFVDTTTWPAKEPEGNITQVWLTEQAKIKEFQASASFMCPVVRFANGKIVAIRPIAQESLRGPSHDQYLVYRTQLPLILAWALSIHKSQGMTLENVEVSSAHIFESGQLYVGLSRATKLEGLTVTGFKREQLPMDADVLEFYKNAPWEDLEPTKESKAPADTAIEFKVEADVKPVPVTCLG